MSRTWAAAVTASVVASSPVIAGPTANDQKKFASAQARFAQERAAYERAIQQFRAAGGQVIDAEAARATAVQVATAGTARDALNEIGGFDAATAYRDGAAYAERVLAPNDLVYRGSDLRYSCRRSDGTTGLIVGATGRGLLGSVIETGKSRTAGALIGAASGALAPSGNVQSYSIRCR